jgi:ribose-phosphate pyrophosphokinase
MTIINLDENFKPLGTGIGVDSFSFPSGFEPHIKIPKSSKIKDDVMITCRFSNANDILTLLLANDAVRRIGAKKVTCFIPYLPFARQDRVMVEGEPFSIKVFASLINSCNFDRVLLFDVHSDVSTALINNSESIPNHSFVKEVLETKKGDFAIISPDAGAYKKIFSLCQYLGHNGLLSLCNKHRDVATGNITSITCDTQDFNGMDVYIVDDICDGGGTFVLLAKELKKRNCGKINLVVSHGIFSKGIEALEGIDHIYTTNSFKTIQSNEKVTQIKNSFFFN